MKIRLALVQFATALFQPERNLARAEEFVRMAARRKADIVAFPEEFLTGPMRRRPDLIDDRGRFAGVFSALARQYAVDIQAGSWYVRRNRRNFNAACYFDRSGRMLGEYCKTHLWHTEKSFATPGTAACVFPTRFGRVGLAICWDLIYPEAFRRLFARRAELIFVPALWSAEDAGAGAEIDPRAEIKLVDAVCVARACENEAVVAFVNGAGRLRFDRSAAVSLIGHTQVAAPFVGAVARLRHAREELRLVEVDTGILATAEESYRIREDLRRGGGKRPARARR
jgi:predicted amidohydrolase